MDEIGYPEMTRDEILKSEEARHVVNEWIANEQHEDLYLDFTRKKDPLKGALDADDRRAFGKALSGFANSDGGLFVWGVVAERTGKDGADRARRAEAISELDAFVGNLNTIVAFSTKPTVPGVRNLVVWEDRAKKTGWVVSYVPAGPTPPYRAENDNNNRFYKRAGSSFYSMEPFDIRDVVFRFRYPKVQLGMTYEAVTISSELHRYALVVSILNHGPSALREYKVQVDIPHFVPLTRASERLAPPPKVVDAESGKVWRIEHYSGKAPGDRAILYPGESRTLIGPPDGLWGVHYYMDDEVHDRIPHDGALRVDEPAIVCRVFGADMPPIEVRKPMREMDKF
jgi:hypothetical protein